MAKGVYFASGMIFGILLSCAACMSGPAYSGPNGPGAEGPTGYYGAPPPPGSHPEISKAMNELQHARYVLQNEAASDYRGHKANAIGYINDAVRELQICMSLP